MPVIFPLLSIEPEPPINRWSVPPDWWSITSKLNVNGGAFVTGGGGGGGGGGVTAATIRVTFNVCGELDAPAAVNVTDPE